MAKRNKITPRPYQTECLEKIKQENLIINLPTGTGKTLIATLAIEHYLNKYPNLKIMFIVPTTVLVEQQSNYIFEHVNSCPVIWKLKGSDSLSWTASYWRQQLNVHKIIVGTPEIFRRAL
eukprot:Pgem_evm1s12375